jgi:putative transposase
VTETNVFELTQPGTFSDPLTEVLRNGARTLLGQAVEAEVAAWLSTHTDELTNDGRRRLVRHGHLPERKIVTASAKAESASDFRRRFCLPMRADRRA